jgi:hypothetical protein
LAWLAEVGTIEAIEAGLRCAWGWGGRGGERALCACVYE